MSSTTAMSVVRPPSPIHHAPQASPLAALPGLPASTGVDSIDTPSLQQGALSEKSPVTLRHGLVTPGDRQAKRSCGARFFDGVTEAAGTPYAFAATCLTIAGWAVAGIVLHAPDNWQIAMQDGSSIQCYASDTLLMRQQRNHTHETTQMLTNLLRSNATKARLLPQVLANPASLGKHPDFERNMATYGQDLTESVALPAVGVVDRLADAGSNFAGSPYALGGYTAGIGAWLGLGHKLGYGDEWQLYINTATAVTLTFMSMFLQNTRRRHMHYMRRCADGVGELDAQLERRLRAAVQDDSPNPPWTIDAPIAPAQGFARVSHLVERGFVRGIDGYSNLVASGVGAGVSAAVFGTWLGIGKVMGWDSNWWLIIGTYTGLMGFIDGFILRNVHRRQSTAINAMMTALQTSDRGLYEAFRRPFPEVRQAPALRGLEWASDRMGVALSSPWAVAGSLVFVGSLIGIASGMQWSVTGQLICNTPTMILEGVLMLVLMQAHNRAHTQKRLGVHDLLERRVQLLALCDELEMASA